MVTVLRMALALTIGGVLLAASSLAEGADPPERPNDVAESLWRRLVEVDERAADVETVVADVVQHKHTALLREPLESTGRVWVRGGTMRWDTHEPRRTEMLVTEQEVRLYYPEQELLEIYALDDRIGDLAASPLPRLRTMAGHFKLAAGDAAALREAEPTIEAEGDWLAVRLTPREEELAEHLKRVDVLVDAERGVARRMVMVGAEADERTVVTFEAMELDGDVADRRFELVVPEGTRVRRPLEGER